MKVPHTSATGINVAQHDIQGLLNLRPSFMACDLADAATKPKMRRLSNGRINICRSACPPLYVLGSAGAGRARVAVFSDASSSGEIQKGERLFLSTRRKIRNCSEADGRLNFCCEPDLESRKPFSGFRYALLFCHELLLRLNVLRYQQPLREPSPIPLPKVIAFCPFVALIKMPASSN
jgi:hypothetical protein